ncbi:MAG: hypothetical protein K9L74_00440 [Candidatus Izimaplasma sp.]|nr:hypothetical protein [Candidatus Izimaplasma bacterium]
MRKTIYAHLLTIILFFVIALPISAMGIVKVNYRSISPGFNNNVAEFISLNSPYKQTGSFHTTSVLAPQKATSLQYIIGQFVSTTRIYEIPDYLQNINADKLDEIGYEQKTNSLTISYIYALEQAGITVDYTIETKVSLVFPSLTNNTLKEGDIVLSVNGEDPLTEVYNATCGMYHEFIVKRDDTQLSYYVEKKELEDTCLFGIQLSTNVILNDEDLDLNNNKTGGPSGGLMQALYIYNLETEVDYSLGLKIAGTGTLDLDGNVGYIGGVEQKVYTAINNNIDIFFVPHLSNDPSDNYIKAKQTLDETNSSMILVGVSTFNEALEYLQGRLEE